MKSRSNWRLGLFLAVGVSIVALAAALLLWKRGGEQPGARDPAATPPDAETYRQMVAAFFSGVAALDADANAQAQADLTRAVELVPSEPAAWANRGLLAIRNYDHEAAARDLERARSLAPENAGVERLFGLMESRRGRSEQAIEHWKRAVTLDREDVKTLFSLAREIERLGNPNAVAEASALIDQILKVMPNNQPSWVERGRLAAKAGDGAALRAVVDRLKAFSASWPPGAAELLATLEKAADGQNPRSAATSIVRLRNLLVADRAFKQSIDAVESPVGVVGVPFERFIKLKMPESAPAPADEAVAFDVESVGAGGPAKWDAIALVALGGEEQNGAPAVLAASATEVKRIDREGVTMPFPGGPGKTAPTLDGVLAADWNSDYLTDLVLAGAAGLRFHQQQPDGTFLNVTDAANLPPKVRDAAASGAWAADIDSDGDLDIVVGATAGPAVTLQNAGDGKFTALKTFEQASELRRFVWGDLDQDGLPDAATLDNQGRLQVFKNERSGRFGLRSPPDGLGKAAALAVADLDGNGTVDLAVLQDSGTIVQVSDDGQGGWKSTEVVRTQPISGEARLIIADLDNNGALDPLASTPSESRLWLRDNTGSKKEISLPAGLQVSGVAEFSGDGRLDLAGLSDSGAAARAIGKGAKNYHWQVIRPRAARNAGDNRINSFGIGGEVEVRAGLLVQKQVIDGPTLHFGLGEHTSSDVARVVWPNGTVLAEFRTKADQALVAEQRLKGSCPFVYADNGKSVEFVTDFLWRSPLGLRINAQDTAGSSQTEDWIKIRGDQLVAREGYYDIRITAELWETHYFDHMSLLTVDHPANTEIFVDERFARNPPGLSVQVTGELQPVASARDDSGNDVTDIVRARDRRYLDNFGRGQYQGMTRDHWVEVEIGDEIPRDRPLVIVAQGWIHPTDSSINVALAQGSHGPPQGLVLEVPTADGEWIVARPDLGFPAGKNKTILVNLEGVFRPSAPRRLRLRTNLEVFWDALAVATVEDVPTIQTERLAPSLAELRPRGYSLMTQANASSPELPQYNTLIGTGQRWRDLTGFYTRFGDVSELLAKTDDRYAIVNAGDEVALRFPAPPKPASGYTRDFVLIGDGWNKDGDFNTAFSETVLPLPSHGRPAYDAPPGALENDPIYQQFPEDWVNYHTRYVTPWTFRHGLQPAARR